MLCELYLAGNPAVQWPWTYRNPASAPKCEVTGVSYTPGLPYSFQLHFNTLWDTLQGPQLLHVCFHSVTINCPWCTQTRCKTPKSLGGSRGKLSSALGASQLWGKKSLRKHFPGNKSLWDTSQGWERTCCSSRGPRLFLEPILGSSFPGDHMPSSGTQTGNIQTSKWNF